ncbi:hypothetical protein [Streptomyces sp. NRRL S-448]|uniref:hypothetical protein n=1 Tax=Streptomyces sp. NRRL S-448 TaxID=1463907 RepID=UPI000AEE92C1
MTGRRAPGAGQTAADGADGGGRAVIEVNPAWSSGGYARDPERVLDVVLRAAGPTAETVPADLPFARTAQR